jgi:phosphoglycolate phosphatase
MTLGFPKAVFFDWDGTLADSYSFLEQAHIRVQQEMGLKTFAPGDFRKYFGKPRDYIYADVYGDRRNEAQALFEKYTVSNNHEIKQLPGSAELLKFLQAEGVVMGVVTNKKSMFVNQEIRNFGWEHFFATVVGAGEAGEDKPSAAPLLYAMEKAGFSGKNGQILYVGDTEMDLLCAKNAGCTCVFVDDGSVEQAKVQAYGPLRVVLDCSELHDFLLQSK